MWGGMKFCVTQTLACQAFVAFSISFSYQIGHSHARAFCHGLLGQNTITVDDTRPLPKWLVALLPDMSGIADAVTQLLACQRFVAFSIWFLYLVWLSLARAILSQ